MKVVRKIVVRIRKPVHIDLDEARIHSAFAGRVIWVGEKVTVRRCSLTGKNRTQVQEFIEQDGFPLDQIATVVRPDAAPSQYRLAGVEDGIDIPVIDRPRS